MKAVEFASEQLRALVPHPKADANKYTRGKMVLVGGCEAYPGAACLAAFSAQRAGAGYVEVYCAPESLQVVRSYRPSLVARSWGELRVGDLPQFSAEKPCACVVGPGVDPRDASQARRVLSVVRNAAMPVLADGGAISALASGEGRLAARDRAFPLVVTPHAGEAARLAKGVRLDAAALQAAGSNELLVIELARAYECVMVLKGPDTFVSDGQKTIAVRRGTAALAKAGTGDVLAGVIGAFLAQGIDPLEAAVLGVALHAEAGNVAAAELTDVCVVPEDVIDALPKAVATL